MIKSTKKIDFDIVIIGAGLSGLSLAIEIIKRTKFTVLLLEKKRKLQLLSRKGILLFVLLNVVQNI